MSNTNTPTAEATAPAVQAVRKVTLYATKGEKKQAIETAATTWGELKREVSSAGFDVNKLHCTENIRKSTLDIDAAILPTEAFVLFMRPKETKSGAELSYKETRAAIKEHIDTYGDHAKNHYNGDKNYTTKSGGELTALLNSYVAPKTDSKEAKAVPAPKAAKEVKSNKVVITNSTRISMIEDELKAIAANTTNQEIKDRVEILLEDEITPLKVVITSDSGEQTGNIADVVETVKDSKEDTATKEEAEKKLQEKEAREKREAEEKADKEESARLKAEAKEMGL